MGDASQREGFACAAVSPLGGNATSHTSGKRGHTHKRIKKKKEEKSSPISRCRFLSPLFPPCLFSSCVSRGQGSLFECLFKFEHACPSADAAFRRSREGGLWRRPPDLPPFCTPLSRGCLGSPLEIGRFLEMSGLSRIAGNEVDSSDAAAADGWPAKEGG
ncbi:hypothetical protein HPB50_016508 [Hyalomma asiaticum]|uniref:Uncharacterized protein n=1 Tax=Hyalomma asiaticum TaxID=266040 RepID=A0ACB7SX32_HYAAI|nr:hypothetical protein HPB50_016508 [Hyalomma asiaticum]